MLVRVAGAAAPLMGVGAAGCRWLLVRDAAGGGTGGPRFGRGPELGLWASCGMRPPRGPPSPYPAGRAARASGSVQPRAAPYNSVRLRAAKNRILRKKNEKKEAKKRKKKGGHIREINSH